MISFFRSFFYQGLPPMVLTNSQNIYPIILQLLFEFAVKYQSLIRGTRGIQGGSRQFYIGVMEGYVKFPWQATPNFFLCHYVQGI
jgi:hypothetical protein